MKLVKWLIFCSCIALGAPVAWAHDGYPQRRIIFVVPFTPGGAGDLIARAIAAKMTESFQQPVVVENKAGAGGNLGSDFVAKAAPDGYTILIGSTSSHAINASLYKNMPYDVQRDFAAVAMVGTAPHILLVNKSLPIRNVAELVAYAVAHPGKVNYSSSGNGTTTHLAGELFRSLTGTQITHVPYKGAPESMQGLMSGQTHLMFENLSGALPQLSGERVRGLAITSAQPTAMVPGMPTIAQTLPGFETSVWFGIFAPAKTPEPIVRKLNTEIARILQTPELKAQYEKLGIQAMTGTPADAAAYVKAEGTKWAEVVKASGAAVN